MKLLRVIRSTDPKSGGPIEVLRCTSEFLVREGHQVEITSLESPADAARHALPFPVHALGPGIGSYGFNPRLAPWLLHNADRYDAVILHGLWNYASIGSWRALRLLDVPYFVYAHGMLDPWFRRHSPVKHAAKQVLWFLAEGRVLRDARAVFFTSEEERRRARDVFGRHAYRERVVLYGTSDPCGDPLAQKAAFRAEFPRLRDRRLLLFLGRIHPKKSCDLLLRAFAAELPQLPENLDLVMAGPDASGMVAGLQALARRLSIAPRVHWPGMLAGDLKWGAFRCAEAFLLPSHQENFGVAVAEAMACSVPVLISDKVNIWHEVKSAGAGLVAPDTTTGIRQLIRCFFALEPNERAHMEHAAREAFLRSFHADAAGRDLMRAIGFAGAMTPMAAVLRGARAEALESRSADLRHG